jgi:hypothetical protein
MRNLLYRHKEHLQMAAAEHLLPLALVVPALLEAL